MMTKKVRVNHSYEALIPRLTPDEYAALKESIREEGLHYPIIVNAEGIVLDGHHRLRVIRELGIVLTEKDTIVKVFPDRLLERRFVITTNLMRRQLTDFQKAELAVPLLEIERELAKKRDRSS